MANLTMKLSDKLQRLSPDERKEVRVLINAVLGFTNSKSSYAVLDKPVGDLSIELITTLAARFGMSVDEFMTEDAVIPRVPSSKEAAAVVAEGE